MPSSIWPDGILPWLRSLPHLSVTLRPVSNDFSLKEEYVQSQMLLVVMVLGVGFIVLLLLAVLVCTTITFIRPSDSPKLAVRFYVIANAVAMAAAASLAASFDGNFAAGLHALLASIDRLQAVAHTAAADGVSLRDATRDASRALSAVAACEGCVGAAAALASGGAASSDAGGGGAGVCHALEARHALEAEGGAFASPFSSGEDHFSRVTAMLLPATAWHRWAATLPLFALTLIACAIVTGAVAGRRALLVGSQFGGVIVWWMMCAITSVQLALAVGLADACPDPLATVLRVLEWFAAQRKEAGGEEDRTLAAAYHFLANCSAPNPLTAPLDGVASSTAALSAALDALGANCSSPSLLQPARRALSRVGESARRGEELLGGSAACRLVAHEFDAGVGGGLCGDLTQGVVGVFLFQSASGLLLLLLTASLPALWHSHWLPPLALDLEPWRRSARRLTERLRERRRERSAATTARLLAPSQQDASLACLVAPLAPSNEPPREGGGAAARGEPAAGASGAAHAPPLAGDPGPSRCCGGAAGPSGGEAGFGGACGPAAASSQGPPADSPDTSEPSLLSEVSLKPLHGLASSSSEEEEDCSEGEAESA